MAEKEYQNKYESSQDSYCLSALYANLIEVISIYKMILGKYYTSQYSAFLMGCEQEPVSIVLLETLTCVNWNRDVF